MVWVGARLGAFNLATFRSVFERAMNGFLLRTGGPVEDDTERLCAGGGGGGGASGDGRSEVSGSETDGEEETCWVVARLKGGGRGGITGLAARTGGDWGREGCVSGWAAPARQHR